MIINRLRHFANITIYSGRPVHCKTTTEGTRQRSDDGAASIPAAVVADRSVNGRGALEINNNYY